MRSLLAAAALALAACTSAPLSPRPRPSLCSYALTLPPPGSFILGVDARIEGAPAGRLVVPGIFGAMVGAPRLEGGAALAAQGDAWLAPSCASACAVHYEIDLAALSAACGHIDCLRRVGDAMLGAATAWMLRPETPVDGVVHVSVAAGDPARFATGLRRDPAGGYTARARELGEASYTAFGALRRHPLDVPGGRLELVLLGPPIAMGDPAVVSWVREAAGCVARLYGRFPADATIFVVPVRGADEVVFGRVMSLSGGSVALLFGADTRAASQHDDWVVVHELSHLGTASFLGEGHWLEEGLATYYEPILRARAGWMREEDLWRHFASQMPRGVRKDGEPPGLEERDDIDSTYWGGALFALLADVGIRRESAGRRSLDDVLRASLEQLGDSTHATTVSRFLEVGDAATGARGLSATYASFAVGGGPVDLDALWSELGVVRHPDGSVSLRDDAPLSAVRRAIAGGSMH